ncbi:hypothetical protein NDR87_26375 [Nocardia sp. CDC159]|uniref:Uncharacterized protein n=1 Tax=Nocardia pulmonis TaxID=2951408 RepID=A0A9X2E663_9NOCA|nr:MULTISPECIES: hypothetical protein [Nocardia]MCM6774974.1 hypothetical protein [Nocardia pulmonis]MCM6789905.1 hypothetical protein [Nocardia sp. CDC159]
MVVELLVVPHVGTPEPGLWCANCQLPSRIGFPVIALLPTGVLDLGHATLCPDCEKPTDAVDAWWRLRRAA